MSLKKQPKAAWADMGEDSDDEFLVNRAAAAAAPPGRTTLRTSASTKVKDAWDDDEAR